MSIIVLLLPSYFFLFVLPGIIFYKSKTTIFSLQNDMIITSVFLKLTKVSTHNLKTDIKGTSDRLKMYRNIILLWISLYQLSRNFMPCCSSITGPLPYRLTIQMKQTKINQMFLEQQLIKLSLDIMYITYCLHPFMRRVFITWPLIHKPETPTPQLVTWPFLFLYDGNLQLIDIDAVKRWYKR